MGTRFDYESYSVAAGEKYYEACVLGIECGKRCMLGRNAVKEFKSLRFVMFDVNMTSSSFYDYALSSAYALEHITIPKGMASMGNYMFYYCQNLKSVSAPKSFSAGKWAFNYCYSLRRITQSSISFGESAFASTCLCSYKIRGSLAYFSQQSSFSSCKAMAYYDLSNVGSVPSLKNTNVFYGIPSDCKIIVPDALYDEWIAATNWSAYASNIIKKSDWDAQS